MVKKWVSPLEKMIACEEAVTSTIEDVTKRIIADKSSKAMNSIQPIHRNNDIIEIDPNDCIKWRFKDRPENELGNIDDLAENMKLNGQIHPVIVRRSKDVKSYELIVGERRWLAAKKANLKLKAIVKGISDTEAALIQIAENDQRKSLSDYAKAVMLQQQIDAGIITPKDLETKLNKSQSYVRTLLSFSRLSREIITAIGDMRHISARSAYELVRWQEKGEQYKNALITLAPLLKNGKIGEKQLEKLIHQSIKVPNARNKRAYEVHARDGRHLFSWRGDTNKNMSISFPKSIRKHIDFKELESMIAKNIEDQLKKRNGNKSLVRAD